MRPLAELLARHPLPGLSGGKDESGTILVLGGPATCPGAALLAGEAALRVGAGRVQLVVDPDVAPAVGVAIPEALVLGWDLCGALPPPVQERLARADAVLVGAGCQHLDPEVVGRVSRATSAPLVLDAGALHAAPTLGNPRLVLAPNPAEAAELAGRSEDPGDDVGDLARTLAATLGVPVAVRGAASAISDGASTWAFDAAPPGLGTPGSGDVLAGVLAGLLGAGLAPLGALGWAVQLHADAGHHLAATTPVGYLASEVARVLPTALRAHLQTSADLHIERRGAG